MDRVQSHGEELRRRYPSHPIVTVGAIVIHQGQLLLVRRDSEPDRDKWTVPGGAVELGERVKDAVVRETKEARACMSKIGRADLFNKYISLYGMPQTLKETDFLCEQLRQGYAEVWSYMNEKAVGPAYMVQQPSSGPWFKNRIKPIYEHDKRDLVWIVFIEYPFILRFILKTIGIDDFPEHIFDPFKKLSGPPACWINRYRRILCLFPEKTIPILLLTTEELNAEAKRLASTKYLC